MPCTFCGWTGEIGKCAICKNTEYKEDKTGKVRNLSVDHCHKTGVARGLLCYDCNTGIGLLKDSAERLKSAIDYLDKYKDNLSKAEKIP